MKMFFLLVALIFSVTEAVAANSVAGRTIQYTNSKDQKYSTTYHKDETSFSKSTKLDGSCCMSDTGKWHMEQGVLCESYTNWNSGREFCH